MIDKTLITRKINLISKDLKRLRPISGFSLKEYLGKYEYEVLTERYLERIITRMIDINYHLITETGNPPPSDYFESFIEVGRLKILPVAFSRKLAQSAGLRNRLVHEYNSLDEKKVYLALKAGIKDIPKYLRYINNFITKRNKQKKLRI